MSDAREMNGLTENEQRILEKQLPGRSLLEHHPDIAMGTKEVSMDRDLKTLELVRDEQGHEAWRKDIAYIKEKDPETGRNRNTPEIKAITERVFQRNEQGLATHETGARLDIAHAYEKSFAYDDQGNVTGETGQVTEGEKKGEAWQKTVSREKTGEYTKVTTANKGKHAKDGELQDFATQEVNFTNAEGSSVWGYHEADGKRTMEWGAKPEDLEE